MTDFSHLSNAPSYQKNQPLTEKMTVLQTVDQLDKGKLQWQGTYTYTAEDNVVNAELLNKDETIITHLSLRLERSGSGFRVQATGEATLPFSCDRCLTTFNETIGYERNEDFLIIDHLPAHYQEEEWISEYADEDDAYNLNDTFDIKDLVRQWIVLESAGRHVCGDSTCKGNISV